MILSMFDVVLQDGLVFDGTGAKPVKAHVGVRDGRVQAISHEKMPGREVLNCAGRWVMPGFVDFHTHYDAELEASPGLHESLRHGVTTVMIGSCSLGAALGDPEDVADIFCRVEGVPRSIMLPLLRERKSWNTLPEYLDHLDTLPLGPNVTSMVGHSNLRMHVMGFERSVSPGVRPSKQELATQAQLLEEALDAGYVGLSVQTLPWDKLDGDRFPARPLPSWYASWGEYRRLTKILRRRNRVLQGVPNLVTKLNVLLFLWESAGIWRKPLRTTVISLMDVISDRKVWPLVALMSRLGNFFLNANFRMQALPNPFEVFSDGMNLVIFEEFGAGTEAINVADLGKRSDLLRDPAYRARFKKQWNSWFLPRIFHRDFQQCHIRSCPDPSISGRSIADVAAERGQDLVDCFLDLAAEYGERFRWGSTVANDRPGPLRRIVDLPDVLIGFSDAGAHLRNMAFYNFPLRLLRLAQKGAMPIERAVFRLTGEPADWWGIPTGHLRLGAAADIAVIDPVALENTKLDAYHEAPMQDFGGVVRLVNRNPGCVPWVMMGGRIASVDGEPVAELGQSRGFGRVLRASR